MPLANSNCGRVGGPDESQGHDVPVNATTPFGSSHSPVLEQNDHSCSVLHLRQGQELQLLASQASLVLVPKPCLYVLQVVGNKWDTYLDLLQAEYSES